MVEKLIKICDFCEEKAKVTCVICDKDCCNRHSKDSSIFIGKDLVTGIVFCNRCRKVKFSEEFLVDLKKQIVEHLKKQAVLGALDDSEDDEEEDNPIAYGSQLVRPNYRYPIGNGIVHTPFGYKTP